MRQSLPTKTESRFITGKTAPSSQNQQKKKRRQMRIVEKPWGKEEIWAETDKYLGKFLYINIGEMLSRQYHEVIVENLAPRITLIASSKVKSPSGVAFVNFFFTSGNCLFKDL